MTKYQFLLKKKKKENRAFSSTISSYPSSTPNGWTSMPTIWSILRKANGKYDLPNKIQFCVNKEGLPVECAEGSDLMSGEQNKEKEGGGFNGEYVGADGWFAKEVWKRSTQTAI